MCKVENWKKINKFELLFLNKKSNDHRSVYKKNSTHYQKRKLVAIFIVIILIGSWQLPIYDFLVTQDLSYREFYTHNNLVMWFERTTNI